MHHKLWDNFFIGLAVAIVGGGGFNTGDAGLLRAPASLARDHQGDVHIASCYGVADSAEYLLLKDARVGTHSISIGRADRFGDQPGWVAVADKRSHCINCV